MIYNKLYKITTGRLGWARSENVETLAEAREIALSEVSRCDNARSLFRRKPLNGHTIRVYELPDESLVISYRQVENKKWTVWGEVSQTVAIVE